MKHESSKLDIIIDTKPLVKLFAQEEGWRAVQAILSEVESEELKAGISVVTLTEVYYKYLQEGKPDLAETRIRQLRYAFYLRKIAVNEDVAVKAGDFKGKYKVPIADALIAASAYIEGATVISDDPHFKQVREIQTFTETEFSGR